jgi:precorrin-8X/cobalt-precorrin-8 methylmutase
MQEQDMKILNIAPDQIEAESFRIIDAKISEMKRNSSEPAGDLSPEEYQITRRMIHATGDFEFLDTVRFRNNAVQAGLGAIRAGRDILVDVNMAVQGITGTILKRFGGSVICRIGDRETVSLAKERGLTRSEAAFMRAADDNIGIVAVGNAPTALLKTMDLIEKGVFSPDLVVGVPVGFVNAAESKEILMEKPYPFITALGNKGGTPVAVAVINALLRLA